MDRCRYPSKPCLNARAVKLNGELHRFCEQHRRQANQNQMRWSKRKQTVLRVRRGDGGDEEGDEHDDPNAPAPPARLDGDGSGPHENAPNSYPPGRHGLHHPGAPPPAPSSQQGPPGAPHGHHNVNAAGASLSHLNLNSHGMMPPHPHPHGQNPNGGLISSFQDHMARGGAIPGTNGVNLVLNGGAVRRELAPAPGPGPHRGNGVHVPPIQTALPPLLPPRAAADQPDPSAVHALLMLERAANVVSSSSHGAPTNDDDDELQVRRELKRAKSNEWVARPTLSPAGLPTVASLVTHGMSSTTATASSSSSSSSSAVAAASVIASVSSIGRSASWQPPVVREDQRESLGQWMQRKQASLPSLSNITRIEKRPYDSISSSAPAGSSGSNFLHRGPENSSNTNNSASYSNNSSSAPHHGPTYHAPLHPSSTKSSSTGSSTIKSEPTTADSAKRSALV